MKAGNLNLLLYHYRRRPGTDDQGGIDPAFDPVGTPQPVGMMSANVKMGSETFAVGHMTRTVDRNFVTRYDKVMSGDRIMVNSTMYDVIHILNLDGVGAEYQLQCSFTV